MRHHSNATHTHTYGHITHRLLHLHLFTEIIIISKPTVFQLSDSFPYLWLMHALTSLEWNDIEHRSFFLNMTAGLFICYQVYLENKALICLWAVSRSTLRGDRYLEGMLEMQAKVFCSGRCLDFDDVLDSNGRDSDSSDNVLKTLVEVHLGVVLHEWEDHCLERITLHPINMTHTLCALLWKRKLTGFLQLFSMPCLHCPYLKIDSNNAS